MDIVIYSKKNCPQCENAKFYLNVKKLNYTEKKLNIDYTQEDLKSMADNIKSYPAIFINEEYIGNFQNLIEYLKELENEED